ncbi:hypothetical protein CAAN1_02S08856 [[Candida] anglica]|uniref:Uncharacterized protein n=1 Tax=[Candida] anglica TaxID=148631 RepID=A0ABP0EBU6_9ASCO
MTLTFRTSPANLLPQNVRELQRVEIISSQPLSNVSKLINYNHPNFPRLGSILEGDALKAKGLLLHAIPTRAQQQMPLNESLDICDEFTYDGSNDQSVIKLTSATYQRVPGLHNIDGVDVRKVKESKKGHGAKFYVSYNYIIKINWKQLTTNALNKVIFMINNAFEQVIITISCYEFTTDLEEKFGFTKTTPTLTSTTPKYTFEDFPSDSDLDPEEVYELLNLLLIDSAQLSGSIDDYISNYSVPFPISVTTSQNKTTRYRLIGPIHSDFIQDLESNWKILSMHTKTQQFIHFRDSSNNVYSWECTK